MKKDLHPATASRSALARSIIGLLVALIGLSSQAAIAQMLYYWKDTNTGQSQMSTIPPAWYKADAPVHGPRVVVTWGKRTIDDTSLPLRDRLSMAGWPEPAIEARLEAIANPPPPRKGR